MDRPSDTPLAFMMEAPPFDRASAILREQQLNPYNRIKDVMLQRVLTAGALRQAEPRGDGQQGIRALRRRAAPP